MLVTLLHIFVGLLGLSLLYAALFLHETEEGQLQNRLEKLWIAVDDLSKSALSKQTAFLQQVSAMANSAMNKLFGKRLFSAGAVSASVCFSLGSFMLFIVSLGQSLSKVDFRYYLLPLVIGIVSFFVGVLPIPWRYLGFPWIFSVVFFELYVDWLLRHSMGWKQFMIRHSFPFLVVLIGGFLSDVLFIAISRSCLRKSSELKNGWIIALLVTVNGFLGLTLISPAIVQLRGPLKGGVQWLLVAFGASNLVTGAISLVFAVLAIVALLHLAIWPVLEKPIYSLQRFGVARQPKLLVGASVTCLLFAWPKSPIIQAVTNLIHG
jgi:hypothetical protein